MKITRVRVAPGEAVSPKMIGKNSWKPNHGRTAREPLVRVETDAGVEGIGRLRGWAEACEAPIRRALGRDPLDFYEKGKGVTHFELEYAIWDLVGRIEKKPVYELLKENFPEAKREGAAVADAYDGALYFSDLLYPEQGLDRILHEALESVGRGYRGIKMKVGRGYKWMKEGGFTRDIEAVHIVREAVGPDVVLMIDGNSSFTVDETIELFRQIGGCNIFWAEEMFPEKLEDLRKFREFLDAQGLKTLIADGETEDRIYPMLPLHEAGLIDVQQLDIHLMGLTGWGNLCSKVLPKYSAKGTADGKPLASPHTWPSQFGAFLCAHLSAAFANAIQVEIPAYSHASLVPDGIEWRDGAFHLTGAPGLGLSVDEDVWTEKLLPSEITYL